MARHFAPSTIFVDEIDALCSARGAANEHEASRRIKSEFLVQMDGINSITGGDTSESGQPVPRRVMVLGATNYPWELDEAMRRRLEKRIYIPLPDEKARPSLFSINLQGIAMADDVDLQALAKKTDGYSGADITNICRDAAMMSMRRITAGLSLEDIKNLNKETMKQPVTKADFEEAISKISRSVGQADIVKHTKWMSEFGAI